MPTLGLAWTWPYWFGGWPGWGYGYGRGYGCGCGYPGYGGYWW